MKQAASFSMYYKLSVEVVDAFSGTQSDPSRTQHRSRSIECARYERGKLLPVSIIDL